MRGAILRHRCRARGVAAVALTACLAWSSAVAVLANGAPQTPPAAEAKIEVNGVFVDWWSVLANPDNVTWDELGSAVACPTQDADCSSMARHEDLRRFAWTPGAGSLFIRLDRQAKAPGDSDYFLYIDADDDGVMETGERVFRLTWGAGRDVRTNLLVYSAVAGGGDPMPDGDGEGLPGTVALTGGPGEVTCTRCASLDGTSLELGIPWLALGGTQPRSFSYHVSSMGSLAGGTAGAGDVKDNLGGRAASVGLQVDPVLESTAVRGGEDVDVEFLITSLGRAQPANPEPVNFRVLSERGLPVELWLVPGGRLGLDANGDGDFDDADDRVDADADGDGLPDAAGESLTLALRIPADAAPGSVDRLQLLASPSRKPGRVERGLTSLHSGPLTLAASSETAGPAGEAVSHAHVLTNHGPTALTVDVLFEGAWDYALHEDDGRGSAGLPYANDQVNVPAESSLTVHVVVSIPAGAVEGEDADEVRVTARPLSVALEDSPSVTDRTEAQARLDLLRRYAAGELRGLGAALPGGRLYTSHALVNGGVTPAPVYLSALAFGGPVSSPVMYTDPNGDGNPSDGEVLDVFAPVVVPARGGRVDFVVAGQVESTAAVGVDITIGVTAFDDRDGSDVSLLDDSRTRSGVTSDVASHEVSVPAFSACDAVYASFGPATAGTQADVAWSGPGGGPIPGGTAWADGLGSARSQAVVEADMGQGPWTAVHGGRTAAFRIERDVELAIDSVRLSPDDTQLSVGISLENFQSLASLKGAHLELSVLTAGASPDAPGGSILSSSGGQAAMVAHDGTSHTRRRSLAPLRAGRAREALMVLRGINWGAGQNFELHVRLLDACGSLLDEQVEAFSIDGGTSGMVDVLRNATISELAMTALPAVLDAAGSPTGPTRLDPVGDLEAADVGGAGEHRVLGDAVAVGDGMPGVLTFYELTNFVGPLRVAKEAGDVVLSGW